MRKVYNLIIIVCLTVIASQAIAGLKGDPFNFTFVKNKKEQLSYTKQLQLRNSASWLQFRSRHSQWDVIFDERTGMPHRSYGQGIQISASGDAREKALSFISNELSSFGIPVNDLAFRGTNTSKYVYTDFYQTYQGLEILNSRVTVRMTTDDRVVLFGADVYKDVTLSTTPGLTADAVESMAASGMDYQITGVTIIPGLKILPVPSNGKYEYRLVYEAKVSAIDYDGYPARYYTLIDANSGEVLYRHNEICNLSATVTTQATVSDPNPWEPNVVHKLPYLRVNVNGTDYYTNSSGQLELPTVTSATSATVYLEGTWSKVVKGNTGNNTASFTTTINTGSNVLSFDTHALLEEISAYYHANVIHDYMKGYLPSYTEMDESLTTRVEITTDNCNAFYDGSSINFYKQSNGCFDLALAGDVVYHEYGHGIDMRYYSLFSNGLDNGAMNEGYSDVWAISVTDNPILGIGFSDTDPNAYVRRYDIDKKVYPQDIFGEVHADGEIICGAWYDTRLNIGNVEDMMNIFSEALNGLADGPDGSEGSVYTDVLIDALTADDDDADLFNGTPHDLQIISAFALHGISLISDIVLAHTEPVHALSATPITISADLTLEYPIYLGNVFLHYKTDVAVGYDSVLMTLFSGTTYQAQIPGQPSGTIVDYYFTAQDIYGNNAFTKPLGVTFADPNLPYKLLCGFTKTSTEDFDNFAGAWDLNDPSDDAETGQWTIDSPVPSYITLGNPSSMVQTNTDHTAGSTSNYCVFTGNTSSSSEGAGTNDVDHGKNTLYSPKFNMTSYIIPAISYYRWYSNDQGANPGNDPWRVYITNDQSTWIPLENTHTPDHSWRNMAFRVSDYVTPSATVQLKFVASDSVMAGTDNEGQSLVEAAIDDLYLWDEGEEVGISEVKNDFSFDLFPNPANDQFVIRMDQQMKGESTIDMIDELGRIVRTIPASNVNMVTIPSGDLSNGIYIVRIQSEQGIAVSRIHIQH